MKKRKIIEVVEGYASIGDSGHIYPGEELRGGLLVWVFPIVYKHEAPDLNTFRKVRITYEEIK